MSDQTAGPQHPTTVAPAAAAPPEQPVTAAAPPEQYAPAAAPPEQYAPAAPTPLAVSETPTTPTYDAKHAWIDGYEPGNPWQSRLVLQTEFGTVAYPLTPHTMPELLEGLVVVAQEQQGITGDLTADAPDADDEDRTASPAGPTSLHDGRAARLTGWAAVHDLWESENPKARYIMGGIVVALLLLGIVFA
ncbi:hypothetical protein [Streptomyces sp. NPDC001927]